MFARLYTLPVALFFAVPLLASASAIPRGNGCNTGPVQCCNSVQKVSMLRMFSFPQMLTVIKASSDPASFLLGLVGAVVGANVDVYASLNLAAMMLLLTWSTAALAALPSALQAEEESVAPTRPFAEI
ncbi:hypothetical protein ARMSODRAFT_960462 [Armillaria solidipes]|uniref:Hydrophobin n=1 Tax=Armillaria solidipes TaxID=1076256 RepID=A0A2H3BAS9_9AGAR|nr:hypothetical protein ARMSODRAFT_960462 [Armillaria solidipes]